MQINNKSEQRAFYKRLRQELSLDQKLKSDLDEKVFNNFLKLTENFKDKTFLAYVSNGFEVDTFKIIEYLLENGFRVAAPRCEKGTNKMNFYIIDGINSLECGSFGIKEPVRDCPAVEDYSDCICIVPGICFDKCGFRIGFGRGFYDRFFSEHKCYLKIGLCYEDFITDKIFADANDVNVDMIVTDLNTYII